MIIVDLVNQRTIYGNATNIAIVDFVNRRPVRLARTADCGSGVAHDVLLGSAAVAKLHYRAAVSADAAECVVLRGRTRENAFSAATLASLGITVESWANDIETGHLPGFVCTDDGRIVGYCFGDKVTGEISVLAVLPQYEGRGIGRALLLQVVAYLRSMGHRRLFLACSSDSTHRSHGFYRHLGWRSTGSFDANDDEILELKWQDSERQG